VGGSERGRADRGPRDDVSALLRDEGADQLVWPGYQLRTMLGFGISLPRMASGVASVMRRRTVEFWLTKPTNPPRPPSEKARPTASSRALAAAASASG
jgi:hypothetical protein